MENLTHLGNLKGIAPEKTEAFAKLEAWFKAFKQDVALQRKGKGREWPSFFDSVAGSVDIAER